MKTIHKILIYKFIGMLIVQYGMIRIYNNVDVLLPIHPLWFIIALMTIIAFEIADYFILRGNNNKKELQELLKECKKV